jgi:hypothetical protein
VNLTFEMPDELARRLEGIAATQHMSIQQFALERLRSARSGKYRTAPRFRRCDPARDARVSPPHDG